MASTLADIAGLLATVDLAALACNFSELDTLISLENALLASRPAFLQSLKERGIVSLAHRQKVANALAKARRDGRLPFNEVADRAELLRADTAMASCGAPLTIRGKTDGFGAQLQAQMSGSSN